jgi:taurine dioxygenase
VTVERLEVTPLAPAVGAEVRGIDLSRPLPRAMLSRLREIWLSAGVLTLPDQHLTSAAFLAFARALGEVSEYPFLRGLPGYPEITEVVKLEHETVNFGGVWHSDTTYLPRPPMATLLIARETPPTGGDTLFASQAAAYEALPDTTQQQVLHMRAVNSSAKAEVSRTREDRLRDAARTDDVQVFEAVHPVVRTHPETGRRALFINPAHTVRIDGMTEGDGEALLELLFLHQIRPTFTCRVRWKPGMLAIWDNRQLLHFPMNDYHGHRRVMHRITLAGDVPV